ncbi:hypothetical protein PR202_ga31378 [Eleusine coracana subsp. coracana]|uniref:Uncharacterized protein n=1 Tax=Eleusine coracana subsp. coracana TaxID=191504 RepID=A0AAV5DT11_ELECO|nr:hypothetical protein PR202_ga31378 [Eleusine coracana subsp. coracana]
MPQSTTTTSSPIAADASSAQKPEREEKMEMLTTATPYSESKKTPNGSYIRSRKFDAGGHSWYIVYYPNGRLSGTTASISFYLQLIDAADEEDEDVKVRIQFLLPGSGGGGLRFLSAEVTGIVNSTRNSIGFERFVTREELEMSGCVSNNWLHIRCDVTVLGTTSNISWQQKEGADVDFEVGGRVFAAHRCILAARSSVLKEDFYGPDKEENTGYMRVNNDMNPEVFDVLLHCLDTDPLPATTNMEGFEAVARDLLAAADLYDLKDLKLLVEKKLCARVAVATAWSTLVVAEQFQCLKLKSTCLRFIASRENTRDVMGTGRVEHLAKTCPAVVRELVTSILDAREAAPSTQHILGTEMT